MLKKINQIKIGLYQKRTFLDLGIILTCLLSFSFFQTQDFAQSVTKGFFFLFFVPFLYVKYILKENFSEFGFIVKEKKKGFISLVFFLIFSLLIIFILTWSTDFEKNYTLPNGVYQNFVFFLVYNLILINIPLFFQEFFFKGFILEIFRKKLGYFSVLFQAIIYLIPFLFQTTNYWGLIPLIIISIFGGIIALFSRSFIFSYAFSIFFFILLNALLVYLK